MPEGTCLATKTSPTRANLQSACEWDMKCSHVLFSGLIPLRAAQSLLKPRQLDLLYKLCMGTACSANKLFTPVLFHRVGNTLVLARCSVPTVFPISPLPQGCIATAKTRVLLTTWIRRHGIGKVCIGLLLMEPKVWRLRQAWLQGVRSSISKLGSKYFHCTGSHR